MTGDADAAARQRFLASMPMDRERWHDGTGYDLDALLALSPDERAAMERRMTPPSDWRDVEALALLDTPSARGTLTVALQSPSIALRLAVLRHAPALADDDTRTAILLRALRETAPFGGLTQALDLIEEHHPPAVVRALFTGLLEAPGDVACHCAELLAVIHGAIASRYDFALRPLCLAFNTDDMVARREAFLALCAVIGVDGAPATDSRP